VKRLLAKDGNLIGYYNLRVKKEVPILEKGKQ
jgi:hypothetical protein